MQDTFPNSPGVFPQYVEPHRSADEGGEGWVDIGLTTKTVQMMQSQPAGPFLSGKTSYLLGGAFDIVR